MSSQTSTHELILQAEAAEQLHKHRRAFKLFMAAAKLGDTSAQINLANYYAAGTEYGKVCPRQNGGTRRPSRKERVSQP